MPIRKEKVADKGEIILTQVSLENFAPLADLISKHRATAHLGEKDRAELAERLFFAITGATTKLQRNLTGRKFKFDALALDILCASVRQAWKSVGLKQTVWETDTGKSDFIDFLHGALKAAGQKTGRGTLLNNVKRSHLIDVD